MAATPKWAPGDVSRVGRGALELANKHKATIEARLPAGLLDGLTADLDTFDGKQSAASLAKESLREATRNQDDTARRALDFLTLTRGALTRAAPKDDARAAFGLSLRPTTNKLQTIITALDAFIDGATRHPEVTRAASLLSADIDKLRAHRAALSLADAAQEATKVTRKLPVADRKQAQLRIEKAVDTIINAGSLGFADKPEIVALFRALVPSKASPRKKTVPA